MGHLKLTRRAGFTMIELLTVMAVITLMTTLLVGASYRFVVGARESATAATVMKASGIIQDRVRAFHEFDFTDVAYAYLHASATNPGSAGTVVDPVLAEVLVRKSRFKKAFPQAFAELDSSQITRFFGSATIPPTGAYNSKYECGIVLFALLLKGETFGAPTPGDDTFGGAEIKNSPETGGLPCLVDAWGEPLRFYRWPTRLIRCAEQNFDGISTFVDGGGVHYDDYNENGLRDLGGYGSAAIRPYNTASGIHPAYPGPTPASLLIANLPPFDRNSAYALGNDGQPGVRLVDDDLNGTVDDLSEIGWPDSDDPELLNTDPDDPSFKLATALSSAALRIQFVSNPNGLFPGITDSSNTFHDCLTFHTPLIVSAGPDKQLGLLEPKDFSATLGCLAAPLSAPAPMPINQYLFDDISNLNQRAGGK